MRRLVERDCCAAVLDIPVARLVGPRHLLDNWLGDPDLRLTVPGFRLLEEPAPWSPPYLLRFEAGPRRRIAYSSRDDSLTVQGDLDSFARSDFRRLLMHAAKVAVQRAGYALVHAACVISPSGQAALLCGGQHSGKSTLALSLASADYKIIATDVTLLDGEGRALAGTRHVNLFPAVLASCFPSLAGFVFAPPRGAGGFEKKIAVPPERIESMGLFHDRPAAIGRVFHLALRMRESFPYCQPMDGQEKLQHSVVINEDWATSTWLSPSWLVFFPSLHHPQAEEQARRLSRRLADRPHERLRGEIDFAVDCVQSLVL